MIISLHKNFFDNFVKTAHSFYIYLTIVKIKIPHLADVYQDAVKKY